MPDGDDRIMLQEKQNPDPEPLPLVTIFNDGTIRVTPGIPLVDVNNLLLQASAGLTVDAAQRAHTFEQGIGKLEATTRDMVRLLDNIDRRYAGLDPTLKAGIAKVLGRPEPATLEAGDPAG